jgi:hypothetical protein
MDAVVESMHVAKAKRFVHHLDLEFLDEALANQLTAKEAN